MKTIYFNLNEGYVNGISSSSEGYDYHIEVDQNHEVLYNPSVFKYENDVLVKDNERQKQLIAEEKERNDRPSDEEINAMALMELTQAIMKGGL